MLTNFFVKFVWTPLRVKGQQMSNFENRNFSIFISDLESLQKKSDSKLVFFFLYFNCECLKISKNCQFPA